MGHDLGDWVRPSQVDAAPATAAAPNPSGGAALSSPVVGEHHTSIVPAAGGPGLLLSGGAKLVGFLLDLWSQGHRQYRPAVASAALAGKANLAEVMASMERHAEQEERLANNEIDGEFVGAPVGLGHGGAAWVDHPVKLGVGFKAGFEITRLWPGCQISLVITQSTKWHVSPLDVFPDHLPPCTILVRVARLDIDRGVYDLSVTARGPEGDAVRLGTQLCLCVCTVFPTPLTLCPLCVCVCVSCVLCVCVLCVCVCVQAKSEPPAQSQPVCTSARRWARCECHSATRCWAVWKRRC